MRYSGEFAPWSHGFGKNASDLHNCANVNGLNSYETLSENDWRSCGTAMLNGCVMMSAILKNGNVIWMKNGLGRHCQKH